MKFIKFAEEVLRVPESVTFWIKINGDEYAAPYSVCMSLLEPANIMGEPSVDSIIRWEGFKTELEANKRLDGLLDILNK